MAKIGATLAPSPKGAINGVLEVFAAADRTATTTSDTVVNWDARGMYVIWDFNTVEQGETVTMHIEMRNPIDGTWNIIYSSAAIGAAADAIYLFYPANIADPGALYVDEEKIPIPRYFRFLMEHSAAGSHNYSVAVNFLA